MDHPAGRAKQAASPILRAVLGTATAANLPKPVDLAVLLNADHHVERRTAYFKRLRPSLKRAGASRSSTTGLTRRKVRPRTIAWPRRGSFPR